VLVLWLVPTLALAQSGTPVGPPTPPSQPATGPGGAEAAFDQDLATEHGADAGGYQLFEPTAPHAGGLTAPAQLPIVLFLSGCCASDTLSLTDAAPYRAWIDHIVQRGAVVIYPFYNPKDPQPSIAAAVTAALIELKGSNHRPVDSTHLVVVGHSYGSVQALSYAAIAGAKGLPAPAAVLATMTECGGCPLPDVSAIPAKTRIVLLVGSQDDETTSQQVWAQLGAIPSDHKDFVRLMGDAHGAPALIADHPLPATSDWGPLDALDWYGTWKVLDAAMSCSFAGKDCQYAFGDTPEQRFMGVWSDGVPVAEAQVTQDPGTPTS